MITLVLLALAEPLALRAPLDGVVAVGGLPEVGAGWWVGDHYGVSVGYDVRGYTADLAGAARWTLTRADSGFGVDAGIAAGVVLPFAGLRPSIEAAPWVAVGWRRPGWHVVVDVAVPAAVALGEGSRLRLPVVVEPWTGVSVGGWTVSAGATLGEVIVPGELPAVRMGWQLGLGWRPGGGDGSPNGRSRGRGCRSPA